MEQTTIPTTREDLSYLSLDISKHVTTSPEDSPMRKRMTKMTDMFQLMRSQVACFMVTEPSIDEELVPKSEDVNGNQEILMDQVLSKSSFILESSQIRTRGKGIKRRRE